MNYKVLSIGSSLFFSFLCLIFFNQVSAQEKLLKISKSEIEINYLGSDNEFLSFEVKIPQSLANKLVFRIMDENGNELFREFINGKPFNKTIMVARDNNEQLDFVTSTLHNQVKKSYFIKSENIEKLIVSSKLTR
ncbi:MAG: hypothetical protein K9I82_01080 [Chitinophagaceae bacterium]|nr:hypothetical protein [Chitinophagaceae bacterium]